MKFLRINLIKEPEKPKIRKIITRKRIVLKKRKRKVKDIDRDEGETIKEEIIEEEVEEGKVEEVEEEVEVIPIVNTDRLTPGNTFILYILFEELFSPIQIIKLRYKG